ncbi:MAG: hypothetical protein Q7U76_12850 [Nitrospirota bacterium]|nr:hypothetical protein [Nitrospirota bacterium]
MKVTTDKKDFSVKLTRLKIKPGDVLVLRIDQRDKPAMDIVMSINHWLKTNKIKFVGIMLLQTDESVETLSEQRMREMGWIRPYEVIK